MCKSHSRVELLLQLTNYLLLVVVLCRISNNSSSNYIIIPTIWFFFDVDFLVHIHDLSSCTHLKAQHLDSRWLWFNLVLKSAAIRRNLTNWLGLSIVRAVWPLQCRPVAGSSDGYPYMVACHQVAYLRLFNILGMWLVRHWIDVQWGNNRDFGHGGCETTWSIGQN